MPASKSYYTDFDLYIRENDLIDNYSAVSLLLKDHTTSVEGEQRNIFWATDDYESLGEGFAYNDHITLESMSLLGRKVLPRVMKEILKQRERVKSKAEVFTPAWICNAQNNLIDEAWFGRKDVFNKERDDHTWETTQEKITFPEGKTWRDYVRDERLEITCGEAPYLVSRYDITNSQPIPIGERIGMLDRKLRVVSENVESTWLWIKWAKEALKSVYGYEWQGDSLLIARENLFVSFIEYFIDKFGVEKFHRVKGRALPGVAYIISWNLWQMDGLKGVVPNSCGKAPLGQNLFNDGELHLCPGCQSSNVLEGMRKHNGIYCLIRDWRVKDKSKQKIRYIDLIESKD